jgi:hypothetical protein
MKKLLYLLLLLPIFYSAKIDGNADYQNSETQSVIKHFTEQYNDVSLKYYLPVGNTYYISTTGVGTNTGQSNLSPWPLSKVTSFSFSPDDHILFEKGDTFNNAAVVFSSSGTSGHPIVMDLYGLSVNNAILDGAASTTAATFEITGAFVNVSNLVIQNCQWAGHGILYISGTHDVTINNFYVNNAYRGIHPQLCTGNISVTNCYITNISHPNNAAGPASGDGSMIQFDNCSGSGNAATGNFCWTQTPSAGVGDIMSIFESNGTSGSPIQYTSNFILGGSTGTNGYCGIGCGDNGGSWQNISLNFIKNSGFAGIQCAGGSNITINLNKIYSAQNIFPGGGTGSIDGIGVFSASGFVPTALTIGSNNINWTNWSGSVVNTFLQTGTGISTPANWSTNTQNGISDPLAPSTIVANPMWTGSPWNTTTTLITAKGRKAVQL